MTTQTETATPTRETPHLWWREPFRMFQTNLREIDAGFDVERCQHSTMAVTLRLAWVHVPALRHLDMRFALQLLGTSPKSSGFGRMPQDTIWK